MTDANENSKTTTTWTEDAAGGYTAAAHGLDMLVWRSSRKGVLGYRPTVARTGEDVYSTVAYPSRWYSALSKAQSAAESIAKDLAKLDGLVGELVTDCDGVTLGCEV